MQTLSSTSRVSLNGTIRPFLLIFIAVFFLVILPLLGVGPAGGSSEAREMHVAQSIVLGGDWILPLRSGLIPSKPPLYHWMVALLYEWGNQIWSIEFAARLVSHLSALLILAYTWVLAWRLARCIHASPKAVSTNAALAVAILMTSYGFFSMASTAMVDMLYAACVVAAIASLILPLTRTSNFHAVTAPIGERDFLQFFVWCGFGALAKGPLALVLPVLVCLLVHARTLGVRITCRLWIRPRWGWGAWLLLSLPWYYLAATHGGDGFIDRQLVFENVQRFLGGEHVNTQPWWFYLPSLLRTAAPWSLVWCVAVWWQLKGNRGIGPSLRAAPAALRIFQAPLWWTLAGLFLFSLSAGKRHSYLLPLYPAISISVAQCLVHWWTSRADAWRLKALRCIAASVPFGLLVLAFFLLCTVCSDLLTLQKYPSLRAFGEFLQHYQMQLVASLLIGGGLSYVAYFCKRLTVWPAALITVFSISVFAVHTGIGFKNELKDFNQIAATISKRFAAQNGGPIGILRYRWEEYLDPLMFYLSGEEQVVTPPSLSATLQDLPPIIIAPSWHDGLMQSSAAYVERARFRQRGDRIRHRTDRDVVVWERRESGQSS